MKIAEESGLRQEVLSALDILRNLIRPLKSSFFKRVKSPFSAMCLHIVFKKEILPFQKIIGFFGQRRLRKTSILTSDNRQKKREFLPRAVFAARCFASTFFIGAPLFEELDGETGLG